MPVKPHAARRWCPAATSRRRGAIFAALALKPLTPPEPLPDPPGPTFFDPLDYPEPAESLDPGVRDRGAYPKVRVPHLYPRRVAMEMGTGGCVTYGFTISASGRTSEIRVLASSHSIFETVGAKAIAQYRYEPMVVDGEAVDTPIQTVRLVWRLEGRSLPAHPACANKALANEDEERP